MRTRLRGAGIGGGVGFRASDGTGGTTATPLTVGAGFAPVPVWEVVATRLSTLSVRVPDG